MHQRTGNRLQRDGFTLIELMAALGLGALLAAGVAAAIGIYVRLEAADRSQVERAQLIRAVVRQVQADVSSAVFRPVTTATSTNSGSPAATANSATSGTSTGGTATGSSGAAGSTGGATSTQATKPAGMSFGIVGTAAELLVLANRPQRARATAGTEAPAVVAEDLVTIGYAVAAEGNAGLGAMAAAALLQSTAGATATGVAIGNTAAETPSGYGLIRATSTRQAFRTEELAELESRVAEGAERWVDEVVAVEFRYFDGQAWRSEWNSMALNTLPRAIEMAFQLQTPPTERGAAPVFTSVRHVFEVPLSSPVMGALTL